MLFLFKLSSLNEFYFNPISLHHCCWLWRWCLILAPPTVSASNLRKPVLSKGVKRESTQGHRHKLMRYDVFIHCCCQKVACCRFYRLTNSHCITEWKNTFSISVIPTVINSLAMSSSILQVFHWLQLIPTSRPRASQHSTTVFYFGLRYLSVFLFI